MLVVLLKATLVSLVALFGVRAVDFLVFHARVIRRSFKTRAASADYAGETLVLNVLECEDWYLGSWGLLTRDRCV